MNTNDHLVRIYWRNGDVAASLAYGRTCPSADAMREKIAQYGGVEAVLTETNARGDILRVTTVR